MRGVGFLISLLTVSVSIHLLRFPHLILENGGGAFLILFFICLNILSLPMLIAEKVLDNKLESIDIRSLIRIGRSAPSRSLDRVFVFCWFSLRIIILISFLCFFLYLSGTSLAYLYYFAQRIFQMDVIFDTPSAPNLKMGWLGALAWSSLSFLCYLKLRKTFFRTWTRWVLPLCFVILLLLLIKIISSINDFEGLKILFYPDFSALTAQSLESLVGHSLACLFIGIGFHRQSMGKREGLDSIQLFIHGIIQSICMAMIIGVMALPMIQQVSETPFGSNWVFEILPRWLSYGEFGAYYCSLFFLAICLMGFYIAICLMTILTRIMKRVYPINQKSWLAYVLGSSFILISTAVIVVAQEFLWGWSGQSLLLLGDHYVIDVLIPLFVLMMLWVLFRYTSSQERVQVFEGQQIFFHNRIFFKIWEKTTLWIVPSLILLGWVLRVM